MTTLSLIPFLVLAQGRTDAVLHEVTTEWARITVSGAKPLTTRDDFVRILSPLARQARELGLYERDCVARLERLLPRAGLGKDRLEPEVEPVHFGRLDARSSLFNLWYFRGDEPTRRLNLLIEEGKAHVLGSAPAFRSILVGRAVRWGDRITLYGLYESGGNSPSGGLEVWAKGRDGWVLRQSAATERESWDWEPPTASSHRKIVVRTRDYPKHLAVPHAGPQLTFDHIWMLVEGVYVGRERARPSALRSLDALVGATKAGDGRVMSAYLPTHRLRRIWKQRWPLLVEGGLGVSTFGSQVADEDPNLVFHRSGVVVKWARQGDRFVVRELGRVPPE